MGIKNAVFFLDLKTLNKKVDEKLKRFAESEELEERDIVKIIYNEANRIGVKDNVKVTFKILDDDDSFRIVVEPANVKYKGTIIYPFEKIKSEDFEFNLDSVCGKVTLYNKKSECRKITVTIDFVALDIFSMTYQKAKNFLKELSDRKEKGGYLEFPDAICFKQFGVKVNAEKNENGDVKVDAPVASIDVFNEEEFFKEYYFEEVKKEEKYDVNIPLPDEYNYENKKEKKNKLVEKSLNKKQKKEIEIELPKEEVKQNIDESTQENNEIDLRQAELDRIRAKQDEELERVKNKLKRELEEELSKSIKKYDEENEKRLKVEKEEEKEQEKEINEVLPEEIVEEQVDEVPEETFEEEVAKEIPEEALEETIEENIPEIEDRQEELTETQKEIKELEAMLEQERKQQEILETRIITKLEELKNAAKEKENNMFEQNVVVQEISEPVKIKEPDGFISYEIESYKGIKEQGNENLSVYFGQTKANVRKYFGGAPKEIRDYDEMEMYDVFYAYYDEEDKCTGIGIYNQEVYGNKIALYAFGKNLITMNYRDIVKLIKKNDYNAIEDDDGIISLKYGISVDPKEDSNYKDEICDVIHIFKKGYYDEVYENF